MPTFTIQVVGKDGVKKRLVREGPSQQEVTDPILQQGYSIISVEENGQTEETIKSVTANIKSFFKKRDYSEQLAIATRQLAAMLSSGITIVEALTIMIGSASRRDPLREAFQALLNGLKEGKRIDKIMEDFPHIFTANYRGVVSLGMNTGALANAFTSLAEDLDKEVSMKKKLSAAMTYPAVTFAISLILNICLFVFVLPKIVTVISDLDVELPMITKILMAVMDYVCNPYLVIITLGILMFASYQIFCYVSTPVGKYNFDLIKLRLPVIGYINRCRYAEQFCRSLSLLVQYSVPIQEAIFLSGKISNNSYMEQKLVYPIIDAVNEGVFIAEAMKRTGRMPPLTVSLLAAGEATGDVSSCLKDAAGMLELELSSALQKALTLMEPIMIVIMSFVVLGIVLAVMLPIYQIIQNFGS
ncbi:MAG: type II secretion system F family protein [bacterium]|nr:type II secretion system F family protein [bacterium]